MYASRSSSTIKSFLCVSRNSINFPYDFFFFIVNYPYDLYLKYGNSMWFILYYTMWLTTSHLSIIASNRHETRHDKNVILFRMFLFYFKGLYPGSHSRAKKKKKEFDNTFEPTINPPRLEPC